MEGSTSTIQVTLLRSKADGHVLLLEARKDFIDILLSFLTLPAGAISKLLSKGAKVRIMSGISSILESVEKLENSVLYVDKKTFTDFKPAATGFPKTTLLEIAPNPVVLCQPARNRPTCNSYVCSYCGRPGKCFSESPVSTDEQVAQGDGFVRDDLTYIVTDTLEIFPTSMVRSMGILSKVEKMSDLESSTRLVGPPEVLIERVGRNQNEKFILYHFGCLDFVVLQLLRSSLASTAALTDVFGTK